MYKHLQVALSKSRPDLRVSQGGSGVMELKGDVVSGDQGGVMPAFRSNQPGYEAIHRFHNPIKIKSIVDLKEGRIIAEN